MKTTTNLVLASAVVVVLMVSALGGVTYSWFSDSETFDVEIGTATVDLDYRLMSYGSPIQDNSVTISEGTNRLELMVENNSTVPVEFEASFTVPRYSAYTNGFTTYNGELVPTNGTYSLSDDLESDWKNGFTLNSIRAISVSFNDETGQTLGDQRDGGLTGDQTNIGTTNIDGTNYNILYTEYSADYTSTLLPGTQVTIPITVEVGDGYTAGSMLNPFIEAKAIQANAVGRTMTVSMTSGNGTSSAEYDCSSADVTRLNFTSENGTTISFDWQALATPNLSKISVTMMETEDSVTIVITSTGSDSENITLDGRVIYSVSVGSSGVSYVTSDSIPTSCLVNNTEGTTTVSFTNLASNTTHTIGLVNQP